MCNISHAWEFQLSIIYSFMKYINRFSLSRIQRATVMKPMQTIKKKIQQDLRNDIVLTILIKNIPNFKSKAPRKWCLSHILRRDMWLLVLIVSSDWTCWPGKTLPTFCPLEQLVQVVLVSRETKEHHGWCWRSVKYVQEPTIGIIFHKSTVKSSGEDWLRSQWRLEGIFLLFNF